MKIKHLIMAMSITLLTGCTSVPALIKAMGKDNATLHVRVATIYGTVEMTRTNPQTNTVPYVMTPEGAVTVSKQQP